jgi:hypothetical protein
MSSQKWTILPICCAAHNIKLFRFFLGGGGGVEKCLLWLSFAQQKDSAVIQSKKFEQNILVVRLYGTHYTTNLIESCLGKKKTNSVKYYVKATV